MPQNLTDFNLMQLLLEFYFQLSIQQIDQVQT